MVRPLRSSEDRPRPRHLQLLLLAEEEPPSGGLGIADVISYGIRFYLRFGFGVEVALVVDEGPTIFNMVEPRQVSQRLGMV